MAKKVWYTIWDAHTDDLLAFGDGAMCARTLGITLNSFYTTVSRCCSGEYKCWSILKEHIQEFAS